MSFELVPQTERIPETEGGFGSDLREGAIITANSYLRDRINPELKDEERFIAINDLLNELALDPGNVHIISAIRERLVLEKRSLEVQTEGLLV